MAKDLLELVTNVEISDYFSEGEVIEKVSLISEVPEHVEEFYEGESKLIEVLTNIGRKFYLAVSKKYGEYSDGKGTHEGLYYDGCLLDEEEDLSGYAWSMTDEDIVGGSYTQEMLERDWEILSNLFDEV